MMVHKGLATTAIKERRKKEEIFQKNSQPKPQAKGEKKKKMY